jgi:predicted O-methyltransferase YrrM
VKATFESLKLEAEKRLVTPSTIAGILRSESPLLRTVGAALESHRTEALAAAERQRVEAIEELRQNLSRSTETVSVPDYGAGSPSETRSAEQMYEGGVTTEVVGDACRQYSKSRIWALLLFQLVRQVKPAACVELGTCLGISTAYQASALELNGHGRLVTLEGSPAFAGIAGRNLESLGLDHRASVVVGRFQDTLDAVLDDLGSVDYAFVDGHHDEHATVRYFEKLLPHLSQQAVMLFDDIAWSPGMRRAWQRVSSDPRVDVSLDFISMGVCLVGADLKARYKMAIA